MNLNFSTKDFRWTVPEPTIVTRAKISNSVSLFDQELRQRWKGAADSGICLYQLNISRNEKMPGKYGFILQVYTIEYIPYQGSNLQSTIL